MKRKNTFKAIIIFAILLFTIFSASFGCSPGYKELYDKTPGETREGNILEDENGRMFSDDSVIAVLTDEASVHIDKYSVTDFSDIGAAEIETYFDNIIVITLAEPGKASVLNAVKTLEQRTDIKSAELNYVNTTC